MDGTVSDVSPVLAPAHSRLPSQRRPRQRHREVRDERDPAPDGPGQHPDREALVWLHGR